MQLRTIFTAALAAWAWRAHAMGVLRFSCSQLSVDRLDPLVNPGVLGSPHLHQIVGGVRTHLYLLLVLIIFQLFERMLAVG